jgi:hypothetical protein
MALVVLILLFNTKGLSRESDSDIFPTNIICIQMVLAMGTLYVIVTIITTRNKLNQPSSRSSYSVQTKFVYEFFVHSGFRIYLLCLLLDASVFSGKGRK